MLLVRPETVVGWHRRGFRLYWSWIAKRKRLGRPGMNRDVRGLARTMTEANPLWGAPRIHGVLMKLGIEISERTVSRLMPKRRKPPTQTWRAFLENHVNQLVSIDFFTVPTATFRVLFVLVVLAHHRPRVLHFNVTEHPTAWWTGQQMIEVFPEDTAPRYLLRDRDKIYGHDFHQRIRSLRIEEVLSAPASPWQRAYVERLIGSIRRDCLDHVVELGEEHLRKILKSYLEYYHRTRTPLALDKDTPEPRALQPAHMGEVIELPQGEASTVGTSDKRLERLTQFGRPFASFQRSPRLATFLIHMQRTYTVGQPVSEEVPAVNFMLSRNAAEGVRQDVFND